MAVSIQYPQSWIPMERDCPGCGTKCRLDVEFIAGPSAMQIYQHCDKDEGKHVPGRLLAVWVWRDEEWCLLEKYA